MKDQYWKATTERGTTYTYRGGSVLVESDRRGTFYIRAMGIRAVDRDALDLLQTSDEKWEFIRNSPLVDIPEVGKSMHIFNFSEWNLSTQVVDLELLEGGEDDSLSGDD